MQILEESGCESADTDQSWGGNYLSLSFHEFKIFLKIHRSAKKERVKWENRKRHTFSLIYFRSLCKTEG